MDLLFTLYIMDFTCLYCILTEWLFYIVWLLHCILWIYTDSMKLANRTLKEMGERPHQASLKSAPLTPQSPVRLLLNWYYCRYIISLLDLVLSLYFVVVVLIMLYWSDYFFQIYLYNTSGFYWVYGYYPMYILVVVHRYSI